MSEIEKFNELVQNTRRDDDYVNATEWCKAFGYTVKQWKQLPEVKRRAKALESVKILPSNFEGKKILLSNLEDEKILPWVVERVGKTWVTWVHPIMAVHLASYLDPAFANYVAEIFVRYVKADPHLAADIASRQETTEGLDIIDKAVKERYKFLEGRDWFYT
ncbi:MAG TPA: KilA-N domain-containing protein, partial [Nostocaceae cyanobacterium]|nr:KilA-N domain-containing protein [Nostocaceae cyanobacterium]